MVLISDKMFKKPALAVLFVLNAITFGQLKAQKIPAGKSDMLIAKSMYPALEELKDYVSIPNDALIAEDIDKNLVWSEKAFARRGFKTAVLKTGKLPLFLAEKTYPKNTKTVLFYFHLDGQAVRPNEWFQKDPYVTVLKEKGADGTFKEIDWELLKKENINDEWRIFARSTSDDKGPIVMLLQALDILASQNQQPPFNVKVVLDCEEEKGSPGLKGALAQYKSQLMADYLIVMDGPMHSSNIPTLTFGCRGGTGFSLTTYGAITQQHSGHFGNYSPDPTFSLAKIISTMKDDDGRVLIDSSHPESEETGSSEGYDPLTGTFNLISRTTIDGGAETATLLMNGKVLVTRTSEGNICCTELYDPSTGAFAPTGEMARMANQFTATLIRDGTVLIAGGYPFGESLLYDPAAGRFSPAETQRRRQDECCR